MNVRAQPAVGESLDHRVLARVRQLIYDAAGIVINDSKASMVRARLSKRLHATGIATADAYLDHVQAAGNAAEMANLISAMTTNVTQFFREAHHFDTLRNTLIPEWRQQPRKRSVWSAACSSGPEPYSIAMVLKDSGLDRSQVRVLATDIDREILARARAGIYPAKEVDPIPAPMRNANFRPHDDGFVVTDDLRNFITFKALNLIGSWPFTGKFDAIFCRNVAIYFDAETQHKLWSRLLGCLEDGGRLFIGHSERLPDDLVNGRVTYLGQTTYLKSASGDVK